MASRAASSKDRSKAQRLRQRVKAGRELSARDAKWLDRYEFKHGKYTKREPSRNLTHREEALRIVRWVVSYLNATGVRYGSAWGRKSKPGKPGYARAVALWRKPVLPPEKELPPEIPVANYHDRLFNVRVLLFVDGRKQWVPILAMTSKWSNAPVDLHDKFLSEYFHKYLRADEDEDGDTRTIGIVGVSVQVSPRRKK